MAARIQNSSSLRIGLLHTWKHKTISVRKTLLGKFMANQWEYSFKALAKRNFSAKRISRAGFIPGRTIIRNYLFRRKKILKT